MKENKCVILLYQKEDFMDKAKIIDVIKLHRRFSICALANKYNFSNADVQAVVNELLDKGVLVQDSEVKLKYIEATPWI